MSRLEPMIIRGRITTRRLVGGLIALISGLLVYRFTDWDAGWMVALVGIFFVGWAMANQLRMLILDDKGVVRGKEQIGWDELESVLETTVVKEISVGRKKFFPRQDKVLELEGKGKKVTIRRDWYSAKDYEKVYVEVKAQMETETALHSKPRLIPTWVALWGCVVLIAAGLSAMMPDDHQWAGLDHTQLLHKADVFQRENKEDRAREVLNYAVKRYPREITVYISRGRFYQSQGEWDKAEADLKKAKEIEPDLDMIYFILAGIYQDQLDWNRALGELEVLVDWKESYENLSLRASTYLKQGDYPRAEGDFRKCIEMSPRIAAPHRGLLLALLGQKKYSQVEEEGRRIVEKFPRDGDGAVALSMALYIRDKRLRGEEVLAKAVLVERRDGIPEWWLAGLYGNEKALNRLVKRRPSMETAVEIWRGTKDLSAVEDRIERARIGLDRYRTKVEVYTWQAMVAEKKGLVGKAFEKYKKAMAVGVKSTLEYLWARWRVEELAGK